MENKIYQEIIKEESEDLLKIHKTINNVVYLFLKPNIVTKLAKKHSEISIDCVLEELRLIGDGIKTLEDVDKRIKYWEKVRENVETKW